MQPKHGEESTEFILAQVSRLHHARVHQLLEGFGLYRGQPFVLDAIWEKEGLTHTELAERLEITSATVTKTLQRMEKAGFIQRRADPTDQRVSRVYLTEAGRAAQVNLQAVKDKIDADSLAHFSEEERLELREYLVRIRENLRQAIGSYQIL